MRDVRKYRMEPMEHGERPLWCWHGRSSGQPWRLEGESEDGGLRMKQEQDGDPATRSTLISHRLRRFRKSRNLDRRSPGDVAGLADLAAGLLISVSIFRTVTGAGVDSLPHAPARLAAYLELQQQEEASVMALTTASRVSPVRF
jgi:hypothetical protein